MTPTQLYNSIRNQINDTSADFWSESELYRYMSDAEMELASLVNCTETTATDTSVADQREYDRPSDAINIERVTWNSVKLKKINLTDLDNLEGTSYGGSADYGNPVYYYDYADVIGLSPIPDAAQTIKYYYTAQPTILSASSTAFTIPAMLGHLLADYCLYRMYSKDQMSSESAKHFQLWKDNLKTAEQIMATQRSTDRFRVVRVEDAYPITDLGTI